VIKKLENYSLVQPYLQVSTIAKSVMMDGESTVKDKLNLLKNWEFSRFVELSDIFMKNARSVWFFNGNMKADESKQIAIDAVNTLGKYLSKQCLTEIGYKGIPKDQITNTRIVSLEPNSETSLRIDAANPDEPNSALLSIFQDGTRFTKLQPREDQIKHELIHAVVFQILDQPSFDFLRTKEQLGYIAYCKSYVFRDILHGGFIVQCSEKSTEFVITKAYEFLNTYKKKMEDLSDEEYETAVKAVIMQKEEVDVSLRKN